MRAFNFESFQRCFCNKCDFETKSQGYIKTHPTEKLGGMESTKPINPNSTHRVYFLKLTQFPQYNAFKLES